MERLNDDILLAIFEYLDNKSLVNAAKAFKRWSNVICSSVVLVRKPTLTIDLSVWKDDSPQVARDLYGKLIQELKDFPYRNFKLNSNAHFNVSEKKIMKIFTEKAKNIEKLSVKSFSGTLMIAMLQHASPTLTHLIVSSLFPDRDYEGFVDLPNLEFLKLYTINSILSVLKCDNLKELDIDKCLEKTGVQTLFKNSRNLQKLKKFKTFELFWEFCDVSELPFQLEEVEVSYFSSISLTAFHEFLLSQKNTLKTLVINESKTHISTIHFILENLTNLQTLKIYGSIYSTRNQEVQEGVMNVTLKTLEMYLTVYDILVWISPKINEASDLEYILKKCKALETFKFRGSLNTNTKAYEGRISLPTLKNLQLFDLKQFGFWHCFELDNVENFTMEVLNGRAENVDFLLDFLPKMPKLKNLQVNEWVFLENQFSIMNTRDMREFLHLMGRCESFRIKRCDILPIRFLNFLKVTDMKNFKVFEISYTKDDGYAENAIDSMKDAKVQTILTEFKWRITTGVWERDEKYFEEDDDYVVYNNIMRRRWDGYTD